MVNLETVLVQYPLPALLNKNFPENRKTIRAVSYPEGVVIIEDSMGKSVMDEKFQYINLSNSH